MTPIQKSGCSLSNLLPWMQIFSGWYGEMRCSGKERQTHTYCEAPVGFHSVDKEFLTEK